MSRRPGVDVDVRDSEFGEVAWAADAAFFSYLAESPLAEVRKLGEGFALVTGLARNDRNGVVCSRLSDSTADDQIADVLRWLRDRRAPGQWLIEERTQPLDLGQHLERAGCRPELTAVFMARRLAGLELTGRPPEGVEIKDILDLPALAEAWTAFGPAYNEPEERKRELAVLASLGLGAERSFRHYVARRDGRAIGIASSFASGSTLLLAELSVLEDERRRGVGHALVLHALVESRAAGCTVAVLGPTPDSAPFYEKLGFALCRYPSVRTFYTPL